jgi:hypothetical protein
MLDNLLNYFQRRNYYQPEISILLLYLFLANALNAARTDFNKLLNDNLSLKQ